MIKRILHITLIMVSLFAGFSLLGFAIKSNQQAPCNKIHIYVDQSCGNRFIDADDIMKSINDRFDDLVGRPIGQGTLSKINQLVTGNPYVEKAAVYRTIGGDLTVEVRQHQPLIRVINSSNQSYYLSEQGMMLPVSSRYTARTIVATGRIKTSYSPSVNLGMAANKQELTADILKLRQLFQLAKAINEDPFWRSMIDHIYVTNKGAFELTPINGAHIVEFGGIEGMEEKFNKLKVFYQTGLGYMGWNYYKRINVQFNGQVVCSK